MSDSNLSPRAVRSFPVQAIWFLMASGFSLGAGFAALHYDGHIAVVYGAMALACMTAGAVFAAISGRCTDQHCAQGSLPPLWVLSLGALGLMFPAFAVLARFIARRYTGFEFFDGIYALHAGLFAACVCVGGAFLVACGFWVWRWLGGRLPAARIGLPVSLGVVVAVFLCGPRIDFQLWSPDGLISKRSLPEVIRQPLAERAGLSVVNTGTYDDNGAEQVVSCVVERGWSRLFLEKIRAVETVPGAGADAADISRCEAESEAALQSGAAPEALLLKGDVAAYLARMKSLGGSRAVGIDPKRIPAPLGPKIVAMVAPGGTVGAYTGFDLALATEQEATAREMMPPPEEIGPRERYGMFRLGLTSALDGVAGKTDESIAQEREASAHTMIRLGAQLGSTELMKSGVMYSLGGLVGKNEYTGGYTDFDFYHANRNCDVAYAEFLAKRGLKPMAAQRMHLLSLVGQAQYGQTDAGGGFKFASADLGYPDAVQLGRCKALAKWYAKTAKDVGAEEIDTIYTQIGAARMAWFESERAKTGRKLPGGAGLTTEVAVAMLEDMPPSFPQYCAWANTVFWSLVEPTDDAPETLNPMLRLQASWRGRPPVQMALSGTADWVQTKYPEGDERNDEWARHCVLLQTAYTNQVEQVLATLNRRFKELGMPCEGRRWPKEPGDNQHHHPVLTCRMS